MTQATLLTGDALEVLRTLPDASVRCCLTSPPYWGLRDYGTATWEGGDAGCDHKQGRPGAGRADGIVDDRAQRNRDGVGSMGGDCGKCGARRIDAQLGLERTPEEYVARMVEVFREVRRVLADDGTLWLNLGSSYASGDNGTSPVRRRSSARAYGSGGTEPQDSPAPGSSCSDLCDECRAVSGPDIVGSDQPTAQSPSPALPTDHDSERSGSAGASLDGAPRGAPVSTNHESERQPRGGCSHCDNCGACLDVLRSSSRDGRLCVRRQEYIGDSGRRGSESRNRDRDVLGTAWLKYTYKPKDLVPIPWLVAMALQRDGWFLRSEIIWAKNNPMPESVTDRPTKAHEQVFLLSKQASYFYDAEAIAEPHSRDWSGSVGTKNFKFGGADDKTGLDRNGTSQNGFQNATPREGGRNARTVWEIATQPYAGAHFATFPVELARRCILAGTSQRGQCPECGKPWVRVTECVHEGRDWRSDQMKPKGIPGELAGEGSYKRGQSTSPLNDVKRHETLGWSPTCDHGLEPIPDVVLDPFSGSGTTAAVAVGHGRHAIGIELNPKYQELARQRIGPLLVSGAA